MTMPKGRLRQPEHPLQEVMANGAACGFALQKLAELWYTPGGNITYVQFPLELSHAKYGDFDEDEPPVKTPITEATMHYGAEDLPILAWIVAPGGGSAAVVVDMLERPRSRTPDERGQPVTYTDCQLIRGTPGEVLPREIREMMGLS